MIHAPHLFNRARDQNAPFGQHRDPVADGVKRVEVMGDKEHR